MKIIDQYRTPDGRHEYRVELDGEILPPMSFKDEKSVEELEEIATTLLEEITLEEVE